MNRRSKAVQMECQKMFLRLYFLTRVEEHDAIVYDLRSNGFLAYVPTFDLKGPVYLEKDGIVNIDPVLLGLKRTNENESENENENLHSKKENENTDCMKYEKRIKQFLDYECREILDNTNNKVKELLICSKSFIDTGDVKVTKKKSSKSSADVSDDVDGILRILPLQRIRVAITSSSSSSSSSFGNISRSSSIRLTLITNRTSTNITKKKENNVPPSNHLLEAVIKESDKKRKMNNLNLIDSLKNIEVKCSPNDLCDSLYLIMKRTVQHKNKKNIDVSSNFKIDEAKILKCRLHLYDITKSVKHVLLDGGRVSYGPAEDARLIFRSGLSKLIENEKNREKVKERRDLYGIQSTNSTLKQSSKKSPNFNFPAAMTADDEEYYQIESLLTGKMAAMHKMRLNGENWATEEDLPTSWETGQGQGADTETGIKASSGGFNKELSLATARQGRLKVAKRNSKY